MSLRNSVSAAACVMVGLALVGNVLKGAQDAGTDRPRGTASADAGVREADPATSPPPVALAVAKADEIGAAGVDDSLPTGSIDPQSGLHRPNPAAYGDAAKPGSSLIRTGGEAVNYLAGNTLRWGATGEPPHFRYFASRGVVADGTDREFVARAWDRNRADLCDPAPDGAPDCRPLRVVLDAKEELQGGRLGTVTIGTATAELIKGNVLRVPQHIPFIDSTVSLDASAASPDVGASGLAGLVDHAAAITTDEGAGRRFVFYGADNRLLEVQPVEAGPGGGHAVRVAVGHWRMSKAILCETTAATGAGQVCFKPEPLGGAAVRLVPVGKGLQALRARALPETRARAVAED